VAHAAERSNIHTVMVGGRVLKRDGVMCDLGLSATWILHRHPASPCLRTMMIDVSVSFDLRGQSPGRL
jgi:hypothetical protein